MHYAKHCALIVLESLRESGVTELPLDSKERAEIIDMSVYRNRIRVIEEFNSKYLTSDSDLPMKPYYPFLDSLSSEYIVISGLNKKSLGKSNFEYYAFWKTKNHSEWRGYKVVCNLTDGKMETINLGSVSDEWVNINLEYFPYKEGKTYSIIVH